MPSKVVVKVAGSATYIEKEEGEEEEWETKRAERSWVVAVVKTGQCVCCLVLSNPEWVDPFPRALAWVLSLLFGSLRVSILKKIRSRASRAHQGRFGEVQALYLEVFPLFLSSKVDEVLHSM